MHRWDIYRAYINFEDDNKQGKKRPILIINISSEQFIACKITSKYRDDELEYEIKDWVNAGLDRQSYVKLLHKVYLPPETQMIYLGTLQKIDIDNIKILCQKYDIKLNENFNLKDNMQKLRQTISRIISPYQAQIWDNGKFEIHNVKENDKFILMNKLRRSPLILDVNAYQNGKYDFSNMIDNMMRNPKQYYTIYGNIDINQNGLGEDMSRKQLTEAIKSNNKKNQQFWDFWFDSIYDGNGFDKPWSNSFVNYYKRLEKALINDNNEDIDFNYWIKDMKELFNTSSEIYKNNPSAAQAYIKKINQFIDKFVQSSANNSDTDLKQYVIIYSMNHYTKVNAKDEEEAKQLLLNKKKNAKIQKIMSANEFKRGNQHIQENLIYEELIQSPLKKQLTEKTWAYEVYRVLDNELLATDGRLKSYEVAVKYAKEVAQAYEEQGYGECGYDVFEDTDTTPVWDRKKTMYESKKSTKCKGQILKRGDLNKYKISDKELEEVRGREMIKENHKLEEGLFDIFKKKPKLSYKNFGGKMPLDTDPKYKEAKKFASRIPGAQVKWTGTNNFGWVVEYDEKKYDPSNIDDIIDDDTSYISRGGKQAQAQTVFGKVNMMYEGIFDRDTINDLSKKIDDYCVKNKCGVVFDKNNRAVRWDTQDKRLTKLVNKYNELYDKKEMEDKKDNLKNDSSKNNLKESKLFLNESLFEPINDNNILPYKFIAKKEVKDPNGFSGDEYYWYKDQNKDEHYFYLNEPEIGYEDHICYSYREAQDWFDSYEGFAEDEEELKDEDVIINESSWAENSYAWSKSRQLKVDAIFEAGLWEEFEDAVLEASDIVVGVHTDIYHIQNNAARTEPPYITDADIKEAKKLIFKLCDEYYEKAIAKNDELEESYHKDSFGQSNWYENVDDVIHDYEKGWLTKSRAIEICDEEGWEFYDDLDESFDDEAEIINGYKVFKAESTNTWFVMDGQDYHNEFEYKGKGYPTKEQAIKRANSLEKGTATTLKEALYGKKEIDEFFKLCSDIGLKTFGDLQKFADIHKNRIIVNDLLSKYDSSMSTDAFFQTLKDYKQEELGDDFVAIDDNDGDEEFKYDDPLHVIKNRKKDINESKETPDKMYVGIWDDAKEDFVEFKEFKSFRDALKFASEYDYSNIISGIVKFDTNSLFTKGFAGDFEIDNGKTDLKEMEALMPITDEDIKESLLEGIDFNKAMWPHELAKKLAKRRKMGRSVLENPNAGNVLVGNAIFNMAMGADGSSCIGCSEGGLSTSGGTSGVGMGESLEEDLDKNHVMDIVKKYRSEHNLPEPTEEEIKSIIDILEPKNELGEEKQPLVEIAMIDKDEVELEEKIINTIQSCQKNPIDPTQSPAGKKPISSTIVEEDKALEEGAMADIDLKIKEIKKQIAEIKDYLKFLRVQAPKEVGNNGGNFDSLEEIEETIEENKKELNKLLIELEDLETKGGLRK